VKCDLLFLAYFSDIVSNFMFVRVKCVLFLSRYSQQKPGATWCGRDSNMIKRYEQFFFLPHVEFRIQERKESDGARPLQGVERTKMIFVLQLD
jgi:hypothetical protein